MYRSSSEDKVSASARVRPPDTNPTHALALPAATASPLPAITAVSQETHSGSPAKQQTNLSFQPIKPEKFPAPHLVKSFLPLQSFLRKFF